MEKKNYKFELKGKKVWVAGHNGMVGKSLVKRLRKENCLIQTVEKTELNLVEQEKTNNWIKEKSPNVVILAAAKVGGILANSSNQTSFLYDNLMIQNNIIKSSAENNVEKLVFLGSSCIYPRDASQPIQEEELLKKPLEKTNEGYALAKIAGLKLCSYYFKEHDKDFITVMPTNLYGDNDNYNPQTSHVLAALINKITKAKIEKNKFVEIWGTGKPKREFLHVHDLADAVCFLTKNYSSDEPINVGTSKDISIIELAEEISGIVGWKGSFIFNTDIPDGTLLKRLDITKIRNLGWSPSIHIKEGLKQTINDFMKKNNF
jgi:GDP-L-fucose synthase